VHSSLWSIWQRFTLIKPSIPKVRLAKGFLMLNIDKDDVSAIAAQGIDSITIELTTRCNSACIMCPNSTLPKMDMPEDDIHEILKLLDTKVDCDFVGIGEPLLHPQWETAFRMAAERSERVFVSTNAISLDATKAAALVDSGIHKVSISMDAADPATYRAIRGVDAFATAVAGTGDLVAARNRLNRREHGVLLPQIQFCIVMLRRNLPEIPAIVTLGADLGVDMVRWQNALPSAGAVPELPYTVPCVHEVSDDEVERYHSILDEATENARELGVYLFYCAEELGGPFHGDGETQLTIGANGDVSVCNASLHEDIRIVKGAIENLQWILGNLHETALTDLLASEKYRSFRKDISAGECPDACRGCLGYGDMCW
jgi:MoaA/NifB/PqqE/SkfB family radical SAM enzyme